MKYPNIVELLVYGDYALFSDPVTRVGGEKMSYPVPTYEAMKGVLKSVYFKPTFTWHIDKIRVINKIRNEAKAVRPLKMNGGNELAYYTYLKDVAYQIQAHFEWNENHPELEYDRNENKHHEIAKRMIQKGGRRDVFLGTRECQAYVEPCVFGEGEGFYDDQPWTDLGAMYHGITYADEAYSEETKGKMTIRFWRANMDHGIITFPKPADIPMDMCKVTHDMGIKNFSKETDGKEVI